MVVVFLGKDSSITLQHYVHHLEYEFESAYGLKKYATKTNVLSRTKLPTAQKVPRCRLLPVSITNLNPLHA